MVVSDHSLYYIYSISPWIYIVDFSPQALCPSFALLTVFTAGVSNLGGAKLSQSFTVERASTSEEAKAANSDCPVLKLRCMCIEGACALCPYDVGPMHKCYRW